MWVVWPARRATAQALPYRADVANEVSCKGPPRRVSGEAYSVPEIGIASARSPRPGQLAQGSTCGRLGVWATTVGGRRGLKASGPLPQSMPRHCTADVESCSGQGEADTEPAVRGDAIGVRRDHGGTEDQPYPPVRR